MKITLEGNPVSVNSLYGQRGGQQRFLTKEGRAIKESYAWQVRSQFKGAAYTQNVPQLSVYFYFKTNRRRDSDNCLKVVFDALTGIVVSDDSLIRDYDVHVRVDKENPRVELELP